MSDKILHTDNKTIIHTGKNTPISQIHFANKSVNLIHNGSNGLIYTVVSPQLLDYVNDINDNNTKATTNKKQFILEFKITQANITAKKNVVELSFDIDSSLSIDWGDGNKTTKKSGSKTGLSNTYKKPNTYKVVITGKANRFGLDPESQNLKGIDLLTKVIQFGSLGITDYSGAFYNASNLESVPNDQFFSSNVTNMRGMFAGASKFKSNISGWDVSKVTDMGFMFMKASKFTSNLSSWKVNNVTNMGTMFAYATNFISDLSSWKVNNVTDMSDMFNNASNFESELSSWQVNKVTNMNYMFTNATKFRSNLSGWNVSNVTEMSVMFYSTTKFTSDLSKWNLSKVTNMYGMFINAKGFTVNDWDKTLIGWSDDKIIPNKIIPKKITIQVFPKHSSKAEVAYQKLKTTYEWNIIEGVTN